MEVTFYQNKQNPNKYLEVHNDGHSHNSVRQFMHWKFVKKGTVLSETKNFTGDGKLHRWRKKNLEELLEDYGEVKVYESILSRG